jgi:DNA-binding CsgD family transcriptional regulator
LEFSNKAGIALVEAAYDLSSDDQTWRERIVEAAAQLLDDGFGVCAAVGRLSPSDATFEPGGFAGSNKLLRMHLGVVSDLPKPIVVTQPRTGVSVLSKKHEDQPAAWHTWQRHLGAAGDGVKLTALDTDLRMLYLFAPTRASKTISYAEQSIWKMVAAHLSSGLRLRHALRAQRAEEEPGGTALPHGADAVIDPRTFVLADASGPARTKSASAVLRQAARRVDRARAELTKSDPDEALSAWQALISARWSMVDWFDSDGRRYILAVPNEPDIGDPRMLTQREGQVASYAALGASRKLISFRLGISKARVTVHLRSAMQKLGAQTQAQLIANLSPFARAFARKAGSEIGEAQ